MREEGELELHRVHRSVRGQTLMESGMGIDGGRVMEGDKKVPMLQTAIGNNSAICTTINYMKNTREKCNNTFKCLFTNARSLPSKTGELEALVHEESYDVIGIAETWLQSSHDWAINIPGYALFRKDRVKRKGGGVCLYVRSDLKASVKENLVDGECDEVEALWVELHTDVRSSKLIIGVCYRPPNVNEEVESQLLAQLERTARAGTVIIMGDFNYSEIDWINGTAGTVKGQTF